MSVFEHSRFEIFNAAQHPYKHAFSEFLYSNPALPPTVFTAQQAFDYMLAVIYPNTKDSVATPADLPLIGNGINDCRVVRDDGDGKAASYKWLQYPGEVAPSWHKWMDMDWGVDGILTQWETNTLGLYVVKQGYDDRDNAGVPIVGDLAGQSVYGGLSANTNLTLFANSGDGMGPATGFVQFGDQVRPLVDGVVNLGETGRRFNTLWTSTVVAGTMTLAGGSITDTTDAIDFGAAALSTSATVVAGTLTIGGGSITDTTDAIDFGAAALTTTGVGTFDSIQATTSTSAFFSGTTVGTLTLADGSITDSSDAISFGTNDLSTTGDAEAATITATTSFLTGDLRLSGNLLDVVTLDTALRLQANGTGKIQLLSDSETLGIEATGDISATGFVQGGNLRLSGNTLSSVSGSIYLLPNAGAIYASADVIPGVSGGLGPNLVTNFDVDWHSRNPSVVIVGASATWDGSASYADVIYDGIVPPVGTYQISFEITGYVSGTVQVLMGGGPGGSLNVWSGPYSGDGIHTLTLTSTSADYMLVANYDAGAQTNFNGTVTNIEVRSAGGGSATVDLGSSAAPWQNLFLADALSDGTEEILVSEILSLRNILFRDAARTTPVAAGDTLFWDAVSETWLASHPDAEIIHDEIGGLTDGDAGHTQFSMLAGRAGGQAIIGGTAASENLTLESTAHATKGKILVKDSFQAFTDAAYSSGWAGTDLGGSGNRFRHVYTAGEFFGLRVENVGILPAASSQRVGRLVFLTTEKKVYVDDGLHMHQVGDSFRYEEDLVWDGLQTGYTVTVTTEGMDARHAKWSLHDNTNGFEQIFGKIRATAADTVQIDVNIPLPTGTYRIIGLE